MSTRAARAVLELVVDGLDTGVAGLKAFDQELKKAGVGGLKGLGTGLKELGVGMTALVTGPMVAVGAGFLALTQQAAASGDAIADASQTAGVSAEAYQELAYAMDQVSSVGEEQLTKALAKITTELGQAEIGNKQAVATFKTLGFTQKEIASGTLTTAGVFERLGLVMQGAKTDAQATAVAGQLLGDKLGPVFAGALRESGTEIEALRAHARNLGLVMSNEDTAAANAFHGELVTLQKQVAGVGREIGVAFLPILRDDLLPALRAMIPVVRGWVQGIADAIKWFRDLPGPVQAGAIAIGGIAVAAGPALFFLGQFTTSLSSLIKLYSTVTTANAALAISFRGLAASILPVAGAIAAVWAAWEIGNTETVKNYIAEWALSADNLTAKLFRAVAGVDQMTAAQAKAAVTATATAEKDAAAAKAKAELEKQIKDITNALNAGIPPVLEHAAAVDTATAAYERLHDAQQAMVSNQATVAGYFQTMKPFFKGILQDDNEALDSAEAAGRLKISGVMSGTTNAVDVTSSMFGPLTSGMKNQGVSGGVSGPGGIMGAISSLFGGVGGGSSSSGGGGLMGAIMGAFQGGGDVGKSAGGLIGGHIATNIGKALSTKLGGTIGSAVGSVIPGLGTVLGGMAGQLIGPLIGKVGQFFKEMFGGPSAQELEGREAAASFRNGLLSGLSATQMLEVRQALKGAWAGNELGAATVIAVRDAYIKAGKSAEEALAIVDRLWRAEKEGGDAVKDVLAEIRVVMEQGATPAMEDFGAAAAAAFEEARQGAIALAAEMRRTFGADNDSEAGGGSIDFDPKMFDPETGSWVTPTFERWEKLNPGANEGDFRRAFNLDVINALRSGGISEAVANAFAQSNSGDIHRIGKAFGLPGFITGGVAFQPTAGIFGEGGPEALVPLDRYDQQLERNSGEGFMATMTARLEAKLARIDRTLEALPMHIMAATLARS